MDLSEDMALIRAHMKHLLTRKDNDPDAVRQEVEIKSRTDAHGLIWLSVSDVFQSHSASRGILRFESVEEVKMAIEALRRQLPAIDQLGDLSQ